MKVCNFASHAWGQKVPRSPRSDTRCPPQDRGLLSKEASQNTSTYTSSQRSPPLVIFIVYSAVAA